MTTAQVLDVPESTLRLRIRQEKIPALPPAVEMVDEVAQTPQAARKRSWWHPWAR